MNGETKRYTYQAQLPKQELKYDFVPTLWASRQVEYLLDQIRLHGEDKELVDEVVRLVKQYGIVTHYTSYLIVEDEMVNLPPRPVPMPMPNPHPMPHRTPNDDLYRKGAEEYKDMKSRDNAGSARASKEIQSLNRADNIAQSKVGQERLDYVDKDGNTQNAGTQYRNIQGRAIYQNNGVWVDSEVTKVKNQSAKHIKFGGNEYFDLLKNQPDSAQFLALGNQVQFVLNDVLYEVFE
jgi:Ca-activated chloride channel family protein